MHAAAFQAQLTSALRVAATAMLTALLVLAGWTPARALPTLDLASQALAATQAAGAAGLALREGPAANWRVRAPGATQLAARPGPADPDLDTGTLPETRAAGLTQAPAPLTTAVVAGAWRPSAARRARAPPTA